jgi:hypothetical protein
MCERCKQAPAEPCQYFSATCMCLLTCRWGCMYTATVQQMDQDSVSPRWAYLIRWWLAAQHSAACDGLVAGTTNAQLHRLQPAGTPTASLQSALVSYQLLC